MERKVALVLKGFTELTPQQRQEVLKELGKIQTGGMQEQLVRKSIGDSIQGSTTMTLGPSPTGCPCCGR
jgi:hypothetical protein